MSFYITLPNATVDLTTFNYCVCSRLKFFQEISLDSTSTKSANEAVVPNTILDSTSYFALQCFTVYYPDANNFILEKEKELFIRRLNTQTVDEIVQYSKTIIKRVTEIRQNKQIGLYGIQIFSTIANVYNLLANRNVTEHVFYHCGRNCQRYWIKVPFDMCLSLVRTREVFLRSGLATIYCEKWKKLLEDLFQSHYSIWQTIISTSDILRMITEDVRWINLFKELITITNNYTLVDNFGNDNQLEVISAIEVNTLSQHFPPCMLNLFNSLRRNHRLHHNARYSFSLFLKDIGLPMKEAIHFWKEEYSKPHDACSNCVHSWDAVNERRYIYSIRHLYGLEGSRIIRNSKLCQKIQENSLTVNEEGGCPFVHFDEINLMKCLSEEVLHADGKDIKEEILLLIKRGRPNDACTLYLSRLLRIKANCCNNITIPFSSPVKYYFFCKNFCSGSCGNTQNSQW